ncbi:MAG: tRNA (adenosine(37)-N6)-dimethylallyltransferase MiaA [Methylophilus sp.]|nr:tRNA (adenosine(37)-N6)-dimethylallyltransferase MiaA [Methylophilus sp.]
MTIRAQKYPPAIFLMGPTASGKTGLAVSLFQALPVELISVDSALVFKGMNIGTAKPDANTLAIAPHHLIDIRLPTQPYSAASFRADALRLMADITSRGKVPLLVGGTMLYFKTLESGLSELPEADQAIRATLDAEAAEAGWPAMHAKLAQVDPETAKRLKPNDMQRIQRALEVYRVSGKTMSQHYAEQESQALPYQVLKVALIPSDRKVLHERIALRFKQMLEMGLLAEVKALMQLYPELTINSTAMRCVGYRQVLEHMQGDFGIDELCDRGIFATRQLAKRQLTWLRSMQDIQAVDCLAPNLDNQVFNIVNQCIKCST